MHALSTALVLASLGAGTLAASFGDLFFTSSDTSCLSVKGTIIPSDGSKGQFPSGTVAVNTRLQACTLYVRKEGPDGIEKDPVMVIDAGTWKCNKLPDGKLHWNTVCGSEGGGDDDDEE